LTDTILNTPLPYFLCGALIGLALVVVPFLRRWWYRLLVCASVVCSVVVALEWAAPDPLLWSDRLVVGGAVLFGIAGGAVPAAYVSWVRRVFRDTNARVSATS
jgi:hypothetical protein